MVLRSEMVGGKAKTDCLKRPTSASVGSRREPVMRMRTWLGGDGRFQPDEPAMADGREFVGRNFLRRDPRRAVPRFNGEGFNSLAAMIHRFLQGDDVERDRLRQRERHRAVGLPGAASHQVSRLPSSASDGLLAALELSAVTLPPAARSVAKVSLMICAVRLRASSWLSGTRPRLSGDRFRMRFPLRPTDV